MGQMFSYTPDVPDTQASSIPDWSYIDKPGFEARPLRVGIVGAGVSGICLAIKIREAQKNGTLGPVEVTIYDRATDYGGTWHANRYPGCQVDIPSHVYQFSFAPNSDWSHFYSSSSEVNTYVHHVARRYGVECLIRLCHTIRSAKFNDHKGAWDLTFETDNGEVVNSEVDVYVSATGVLSQVNRPNIPGLGLFTKNPVLHTAEWPVDLDWKTAFKGEKVAVVGNGSSGLQTVGAITPFSKSVDVYARSKFWISPPLMSEAAGDREWVMGNSKYTEEEKETFRKNPHALYEHGTKLSAATMHLFDLFRKGSKPQLTIQAHLRASMAEALGDETLIRKLVPDWEVWCRRVTPAASFIKAVREPHVRVITDSISRVTANSIITSSGEEKEVDRIILATGFDTTFKPKYEVRGLNGVSLSDVWSDRAKAYMSLAVSGFPNLFFVCGPGTIFANGSGLPGVELNSEYIVSALEKIQKQDIKYMEVSKVAQDEYNIQQDALMKDLVFTGSCSSWYKTGKTDGSPDALFAGSSLQFMELLASPRWEDWNFTSWHRNRFSFLGNGIGTIEATNGNRASYLKLENHVHPIKTDEPITDKRSSIVVR